jgi:hypothetical protein
MLAGLMLSAAAAAPVTAAEPLTDHLARLAEVGRAHGGDLSQLTGLDAGLDAAALRERPAGIGLIQLASVEPAVRLHLPAPRAAGLADDDLDGIPDRAAAALRVAVQTLELSARLGLGSPGDDGDGELDLYLLPLRGLARGWTVIEQPLPPGRGGAGFGVVDVSHQQDEAAFLGMVARTVARLVLAARDARAPAWWAEPSALWLETRVTGATMETAHCLHARWTRPELGLETGLPPVLRGNAGLLWSLSDPHIEGRVLAATWTALARREHARSALEVIERALLETTGATVGTLLVRAGVQQVVHGLEPARWTDEIGELPRLDVDRPLKIAPRGVALIAIEPDPREPEGTRLGWTTDSPGWTAALIAARRDGGWDLVQLAPPTDEPGEVVVPWTDYSRAVVLLARWPADEGEGELLVRADAAGAGGLFALSSLSAQVLADGIAELTWSSTWEQQIHGWIIERSPAPDGPWTAVNELPVPALGLPREGTHYMIQDPFAGADGTLYYRVVAITAEGLRLTGPSVALGR